MKTIEFKIEWMTCGWCAGWIAGTLNGTEWIKNADVSHETKLAKVEYDENTISKDKIFTIIKEMNYIPSDV